MKEVVLQKFIADSGYCSRRQAEDLIRKGSVEVNGLKAEPGRKVSDKDEVKVNGEVLRRQKNNIYIKLHKPIGYTCTNKRFPGEKNIFDLVDVEERLFVAGRLDKDSRGLVLVTNDGDWANRMTHPSFEHEKEYEVKIKDQNAKSKEVKEKMIKGVDIGGGDGVVSAEKVEKREDNIFEVVLIQGKNRQIRRMFEALDMEVTDLKRTRLGDIKLGELKSGQWQYLGKVSGY